MHRRQSLTDHVAGDVGASDHTDNRGVCVRPQTPDMQIRNMGIALRFDELADFLGDVIVRLVQQNGSRVAHQAP